MRGLKEDATFLASIGKQQCHLLKCESLGRSGFGLGVAGEQKFPFEWIYIEMSIRYPSGNVVFQVGHSLWNSRKRSRQETQKCESFSLWKGL